MNAVLLSGGSGKRLWPLSSDIQSKQFLKLLRDDRGEYESMVQRVMRQLKTAHPDISVYVSSNKNQRDSIRRQLGEVETILEPERRDTFPAIALAAAYLRYRKELDEEEAFIVCPIDPFAEAGYFERLAEVNALVASGGYDIGLLGVSPTFPTEKYGYILQTDGRVSGFREKPAKPDAQRLIDEGALWNCGVFALRIGYVLRHARKYADFDSFEALYDQYACLPKISFDYEVVEKEVNIGSVTYSGIWKDLGTWNTLAEEMKDQCVGEDVLLSGCENTHVLNMLDIPVIAQDLRDLVVVASHDGILVSSKEGSSYLKPLAEKINLRPMYEQREWGTYRVLEYKRLNGSSSMIKRLRVDAGKSIGGEAPLGREMMWMVLGGKGIWTANGKDSVASPGGVIGVMAGSRYSLLAATEMELLEVQIGEGDLDEGYIAGV